MHGGRNTVIVAMALLAVWLYSGRLLGFRSWEWHQKLVLEVDTPTGTKTGGSTVAIHASTDPKWVPISAADGIRSEVKGEASFVEISPGKYLFATVDSNSPAERAAFTFPAKKGVNAYDQLDAIERVREARTVWRGKYPDLFTFLNNSDPSSVEKVDPNNLEASFGPGVFLKRITLEITNEPVTDGAIGKILAWLPDYYKTQFDGSQGIVYVGKYESPANSLSSGAFKTP
ncbi:hypothetical protein [Mesorhizobium japonicum]|uniref:Mll9766 protein n=1 Tax=Mesorhizobium japonicum (strain LMG 29417 / CECT 9101 / MAFF 303099) TaxID=266835 RepID=Q98P23_RHILO|nr:hypothetical protein [Mesorhizobium japonicum]BAB54832.1 mll9766 [Mesorhizobium japonicum MAFF 303099]